jgi:RecB family exonuclease
MPSKITAWSFSRYNTYRTCPRRAKYLYIDKMKEPGSPAMDRGSDIHKLAERYVKGQVARLPPVLALFRDRLAAMRKAFRSDRASIAVEETWAFRRDWTRTTWDDWDGCWLRIKLDVAHVTVGGVEITDWKTGKFSPQYNLDQYVEQLELYALGSLIVYPDQPVTPYLRFTDHEITYPAAGEGTTYVPADLPRLKKAWEKKTRPMLSDSTFAPRANSGCRWCHFRKDNGGPCPL